MIPADQALHHRIHLLLFAFLLLSSSTLLSAQPVHNSTAKLSTSWVNLPSSFANDTSLNTFTPILSREMNGSTFICGFSCNSDGNFLLSRDCIFGVFISKEIYSADLIVSPQLVWSANRNNPVRLSSTLQLSQDGDLILKNSDGALVWSSDTAGKSVAGMNLTENGNLVLFGQNNQPIWQSFDYPTDSLLSGQKLKIGQRLTASVSASNQSEGVFYLSLEDKSLAAYVNSYPPQRYHVSNFDISIPNVEFTDGSFSDYDFSPAARFMKLGPDGHLKVFRWGVNDWTEVADLLSSTDCDYPMVCGKYGVCSSGQCSCPELASGQGNIFKPLNFRQLNLGCSLVSPISCYHSQDHRLLELTNTTYFGLFPSKLDDISVEDCKNRCLSNCSCKGAAFSPGFLDSPEQRGCLLLHEVFSISSNENQFGSETKLFIKVQNPYAKDSRRKTVTLASIVAAIFVLFSVIGFCLFLFKKRNKQQNETEEDFLNHVPGMPTRYSYGNLKAATEGFSKKLGEGGFGSVYEGALSDGTKVAVKCIDGLAKVKDSFLVELKAIGSIHHVNLVTLIGYCFEKSHRLLVYEYMVNGSLDGWIFSGEQNQYCLPWHSRRKIISDIAKGLAYLHEDCNQKVIHLDIKPQNILLDHNFNAKISDFGLSKLIEKDKKSGVVTTMRGTPGYLAPEWLSSIITEKVDVYSFGIVMLEIICERKNVDWSRTEEDDKHLLRVFKRKAEEEKLEEMVNEKSEEMVNHIEEAVELLRIAAWCLQGDFTRRPSMSLVVKVLEGLVAAETNLDYDFLNPTIVSKTADGDPRHGAAQNATQLPPLSLSGPR